MKRFLVGIVVLGLVLSVFAGFGSISFAQKKYNEAPMLADLVKQGKLPPVEQRLPEEPLVYKEGVEIPAGDVKLEIGKYGGTLRIVNPGAPGGGEGWGISREPLLNQPGFGQPGKKPDGNVLKGFDMSKDAKTFTLYLRKGMKWSDGEPVTTEDVRFAYEDVLLNKELTPTFPVWLANLDGTPFNLEIVDKYTFRVIFKESYGLFPYTLSLHWQTWDSGPLLQPSHYMKKFHIKYTSQEQLQPLLKKNGLSEKEWARLYWLYAWEGSTLGDTKIGCPTLAPYVLVDMPSPQVGILRRNPYYWKVDAAGNQLPYIDEVRADSVTRSDMVPMKIMGGEVDLARQAVSIKEVALYKENEAKGGYKVKILKFHCPIPITFNYSNPDPVWRKIVWDKRFREALNLAINRKEIIDAVYNGFASPSRITPSEYNPAKANQILDSMGLNKRDSEGWRLRPDGKRMELLIETYASSTDFVPMCELLVENWKTIGVYTTMKYVDSSLLSQRVRANQTQVIVSFWLDLPVIQGNPYMIGGVVFNSPTKISMGFYEWYNSYGKKGVEPPATIKPIFTIPQKMRSTTSPMEIKKYLETWEKAVHDSLFWIIPVEDVMIPLIVNERLGNVPDKGYQIMANFAGEALFYK